MKIELNKLIINNFKGIKHLVVDFGATTNIYGANEAGKTTVFDAFLWLLFGKDSTDREKFGIKNTVDTSLNRQDHEVTALLELDDREVEIKRVYREKWTKPRGAFQAQYSGNETEYFWNDVPCKQSEYQQRIKDLIDEKAFKLLTNTQYFNTVISWQDRRSVLLKIAGEITDDQVFDSLITPGNKSQFTGLINLLNQGEKLDDIKKRIAAKKKDIKDQLAYIPTRIDEVKRGIPEQQDWKSLERRITSLTNKLSGIDESILNASKALQSKQAEQRELQQNVYELQRQCDGIIHKLRSDVELSDRDSLQGVNQVNQRIQSLKIQIKGKEDEIKRCDNMVNDYTAQKDTLLKKWAQINAEHLEYDEHAFKCPTCKRELDVSDIEAKRAEMEKNFNDNKKRRLDQINAEGRQVKESIDNYQQQLNVFSATLEQLQAELSDAERQLSDLQKNYVQPRPVDQRVQEMTASNGEYQQLQADIASLKVKIQEVPQVDNTEMLQKKQAITSELDDVKKLLSAKVQIETANKRVEELVEQEQKLSQEQADQEGIEYAIEQFTKAKMDLLVSRINDKFQLVKFKLFDTQVNGGTVEVCETMYNEVPFSDLNTAAKVQAGIDIINTLSRHYKVQAPIFIDNRESVTWIPDTDNQLINLIVSSTDKQLRVETAGIASTLFA